MQKLLSINKLIQDYNIKGKKSLGQNFLIDEEIFSKIAHNIKFIKDKNILEIGPGLGSLSRIILDLDPAHYIAIEKDENFIEILQDLQKHYPEKFQIKNEDALKIKEEELFEGKFSIVANLPYNIATELLFKWLELPHKIDSMYLMFQKEVAERIVAKPRSKAYGKLAIVSQLITIPEILFDIPPTAFIPAPKITSSFVRFKFREKPLYDVDINKLKTLLNVVFNARRKMLRKSLKFFDPNPEIFFKESKIDLNLRPEDLSIEQLCRLAGMV